LFKKNEFFFIYFFKEKKILKKNLNDFMDKLYKNENSSIFVLFPVFKTIFFNNSDKIDNNVYNIQYFFKKDRNLLISNNIIKSGNTEINDITIGAGDFHNGTSTSIIKLSDNRKLIFKPTSGAISDSYFKFLDWFNIHFELGNYKYKILNKKTYHWQEFIYKKPCLDIEDLLNYYTKAGHLTCILYVWF
ncbi:DUF4135 domain-containing protein, partial [Aquimarina agarilytica]|uniref:DUF4135 domain-containing protein n=1 Tax=Aquimarina agarilytica TaxID=1087449 RepID=UPI00028948F3